MDGQAFLFLTMDNIYCDYIKRSLTLSVAFLFKICPESCIIYDMYSHCIILCASLTIKFCSNFDLLRFYAESSPKLKIKCTCNVIYNMKHIL